MKSAILCLFWVLTAMASQAQDWVYQNGQNTCSSITMLDSTTMVITGESGTILRSTDAGDSWNYQNSPVTDYLLTYSDN